MNTQAVNARTVKDFLFSIGALLVTIVAAFSFLRLIESSSTLEAVSSDSIPSTTQSSYKKSTYIYDTVEDVYEPGTSNGSIDKGPKLAAEVADVASHSLVEVLKRTTSDPMSLIENGDFDRAASEILAKSHELAKFSPIIDTNIDLERYNFLQAFVDEHPKLAQHYELTFELFTIGSVNGIEGTKKYFDSLKRNHGDRLKNVCTDMYLYYHSNQVRQKVESCAETMGTSVVYEYLMNIYFDGDISRYETEYQTFRERYQLKPVQEFSEELEYIYES